ncbi:hypothetical protein [Pseudomonas sp. ACN8]|uniref:hypothetical protein n=1 Tax=Pseudomonas sp. ACN8 TaxID=1920428 RepID=UPI0011428A53|nr:hypothetical protein [Pseudomonas sp. ACN8]
MTKEFKRQSNRHLHALYESGTQYSIYLVGPRVDIVKLPRFFRRFLKQRLGMRPKFHLFWFNTNRGLCIAISSTMPVRRITEDFYTDAVRLGHIEGAHQLYIGGNKTTLTTTFATITNQYQPQFGVRTFGGSVVSPTADQTAARSLAKR